MSPTDSPVVAVDFYDTIQDGFIITKLLKNIYKKLLWSRSRFFTLEAERGLHESLPTTIYGKTAKSVANQNPITY